MKIHPKIWDHIAKMYDYYYSDTFPDVLLALQLKTDTSNIKRTELVKFLTSLPVEDGLIIIKDILNNEQIKLDKYDNWNIYGDFIKYWRPQLIEYLKDNGIEYAEDSKNFSFVSGEPIIINTTARKVNIFLDVEFKEFFYDFLKDEINKTYQFGFFTSAMFLSRKLLENLVIEILRIKYPPNINENLSLYYNIRNNRFNDFNILLKNFEDKKKDFNIDEQIITEFISLIKPFKERANSNAHSIVIISNEDEILKYEIQKMAALLLKLWNNVK